MTEPALETQSASPGGCAERSGVAGAPSPWLLAIGALGVVYGDIGTSPLYAFRQCFIGPNAVAATPEEIIGVLSLIFWSLILVVSVKYLAFVLRADNQGEGGIFALLALILPSRSETPARSTAALTALGLFGAALLYGDGAITPAISVLSAVEGLEIATNRLSPYVVPITVLILVALFRVEHHGTARVSAVFGPTMLLWFVTIGVLGAIKLANEAPGHPSVIGAIDPSHAFAFFARHGAGAFFVLGSVVLVVTGSEALYADLGHFGAPPIRTAWYLVVLPSLVLNYFGQGVLVLERGAVGPHPFYDLAPGWFLYPMIALATVATVIASQALISGAYSLSQQAAELDFLPRMRLVHTSDVTRGQIYMPDVNGTLMILCVGLVLGFRSSDALASAYGIAVTGTMTVTSVLFFVAARRRWGWPWPVAALPVAVFLAVDLTFLGANLDKIGTGGWFPIAVALLVFILMTSWKRGKQLLIARQAEWLESVEDFLAMVERNKPVRVPGTAVYLSAQTSRIPSVLMANFLANRVLHERVVLLSTMSVERPRVARQERATVVDLGQGFYRAVVLFGFMETPSIEPILSACAARGLAIDSKEALFFFSRFTPVPTGSGGMARWRKLLFAFMVRNAPSLTRAFSIPPARVVELGAQVEL